MKWQISRRRLPRLRQLVQMSLFLHTRPRSETLLLSGSLGDTSLRSTRSPRNRTREMRRWKKQGRTRHGKEDKDANRRDIDCAVFSGFPVLARPIDSN